MKGSFCTAIPNLDVDLRRSSDAATITGVKSENYESTSVLRSDFSAYVNRTYIAASAWS